MQNIQEHSLSSKLANCILSDMQPHLATQLVLQLLTSNLQGLYLAGKDPGKSP